MGKRIEFIDQLLTHPLGGCGTKAFEPPLDFIPVVIWNKAGIYIFIMVVYQPCVKGGKLEVITYAYLVLQLKVIE